LYQIDFPWLLALLPLPILVWWLLPPYREETASVRLPFFREVAQASGLAPTRGAVIPKTNWLERLLAPVCWGLVVLALARPQYVDPPIQKVQPARDLLLALDLSQSMDTRDFKSPDGALITRFEAVRSVVTDFVRRRTADRIGMIVFGDAPYPEAPFTLDHVTVETMIANALPGMAGPRTALGDAIGLAIKMFADSKVSEKVLVVLTDGNDTASKMPTNRAADIARENGIVVHTVGIGNPQQGKTSSTPRCCRRLPPPPVGNISSARTRASSSRSTRRLTGSRRRTRPRCRGGRGANCSSIRLVPHSGC
jgi:Ca-activated chloride channel family protein